MPLMRLIGILALLPALASAQVVDSYEPTAPNAPTARPLTFHETAPKPGTEEFSAWLARDRQTSPTRGPSRWSLSSASVYDADRQQVYGVEQLSYDVPLSVPFDLFGLLRGRVPLGSLEFLGGYGARADGVRPSTGFLGVGYRAGCFQAGFLVDAEPGKRVDVGPYVGLRAVVR